MRVGGGVETGVWAESTSPPLSIVIPTYNRAGQLDRCLHALLAQQTAPAEVIVVDDA